MPRLVASMIVKNELHRYLELCIDHLLGFCDEVRVVDSGSDDGTYEWLLEQPGVSVMTGTRPFFEHEGKARQELLNWTLDSDPLWVLAIDADEFVSDPDAILECIAKPGKVFTLSMEEIWNVDSRGLERRIDGHWGPRRVPILYRAKGQQRLRIRDRALACGREPESVAAQAGRAPESGASVFHFGWTRESERVVRAERYFEHDGGKFHRDRHLQSILWPRARVKLARRPWPGGLEYLKDELVLAVAR